MCVARLIKGAVLLIIVGLVGCQNEKLGGKTVSETFDDPRVAALVDAAVENDRSEVSRQVAAGADVNAVGKGGVSPLIWVLTRHALSGAEHLMELGANPNYMAPNGFSAMSLAAGGNQPDVLRLLLKHGGNPNLMGHDGRPILHIAVLNMRWEQMRFLLEHGGDINIVRPSTGDTAANIAARLHQFDQVDYMLEHGFNTHLEDLAKFVEISQVAPGSEADRWKQRVAARLKAAGVRFPVFGE